jgi:4-hydroxybenzoate polyprenyltransferase
MSNIHTLASRLPFWIQVTRLDRPVGWLVLLWPTWIALALAAKQTSWSLEIWLIFTAGVILTRSAGCVVNDLTDRDFDRHVKRTKTRPLTSGNMHTREAVLLAVVLLALAFALVLLTNPLTVGLSVIAVLLAIIYPWLKRVTFWPQLGLGLAFSMAIPMAFSAHNAPIDHIVALLFVGNLAWTLAYDTFYAMVDRDDDLNIGVKSTAIALGRFDLIGIGLSQCIALAAFAVAFWFAGLHPISYLGVLMASGLAFQHQWIAADRSRENCFRAFLENHRLGASLFFGVLLDAMLQFL